MSEDETAPGPKPDVPQRSAASRVLKALLVVALIAVAVVVLFTWVFPWVEEVTQNPTLGVQLLRVPR